MDRPPDRPAPCAHRVQAANTHVLPFHKLRQITRLRQSVVLMQLLLRGFFLAVKKAS